ncbi:MAG: ATP-binding protein [Deltaproteobacteria bacterium SG8_13]|nr:MAG: ATP-binding protein [Deltaproteobacteria bacterium SG8_13]
MEDFEKLGVFYLGKKYDLHNEKTADELILYDAKDLTTHAICVGMTGSGKTGLCVSLIEEAGLDGIPVIAIDPKGDLVNLALTFPDLKPEDFRPWIDEGEALRKGMPPAEYARTTAALWKKGLADWGQDGSRIERLRQAAEVAVYTPGSRSGRPITVLRSFDAPADAVIRDNDLLQERIGGSVAGMLALLGIESDPLRSREYILLASIFQHYWTQGVGLDLAGLIRAVQTPPFEKIGVFDLESFFAADDRFELAIRLNNLLASPGFAAWMEGEPLSIPDLLYSAAGKPRISILSIAHLSESERMFFVTIVLNELLAWMRTQPGTSSLRAILYMDEIFGYFPPTANPPSKKPMLTLLKQARAFGVGVMLATQNPVDLDYKGLSNTGTWFLGRLQTERDKQRVLDGLEGVSAGGMAAFDRSEMENLLASLGSRVFLLHNVHETRPVVFRSRWAMSYLRGPMTRTQIEMLSSDATQPVAAQPPAPVVQGKAASAAGAQSNRGEKPRFLAERPPLPADIEEVYVEADAGIGSHQQLVYRPGLWARARLHFVSARARLDHWQELHLFSPFPARGKSLDWDQATAVAGAAIGFLSEPVDRGLFTDLPAAGANPDNYAYWRKDLTGYLHQNRWLTLYSCRDLKAVSTAGEDEGRFRGRLQHLVHEKRDMAVERTKKRYERRFDTLRDRIHRLEERLEREEDQYKHQKIQAGISIGATLLGALFGRKVASTGNIGRATTAVRGVGRAGRERQDIERAKEQLSLQYAKLEALEDEFRQELDKIELSFDPADLVLEELLIRPRKSDITVAKLSTIWWPWRMSPDGLVEPAFTLPG